MLDFIFNFSAVTAPFAILSVVIGLVTVEALPVILTSRLPPQAVGVPAFIYTGAVLLPTVARPTLLATSALLALVAVAALPVTLPVKFPMNPFSAFTVPFVLYVNFTVVLLYIFNVPLSFEKYQEFADVPVLEVKSLPPSKIPLFVCEPAYILIP